jgi:hypothetical protein
MSQASGDVVPTVLSDAVSADRAFYVTHSGEQIDVGFRPGEERRCHEVVGQKTLSFYRWETILGCSAILSTFGTVHLAHHAIGGPFLCCGGRNRALVISQRDQMVANPSWGAAASTTQRKVSCGFPFGRFSCRSRIPTAAKNCSCEASIGLNTCR